MVKQSKLLVKKTSLVFDESKSLFSKMSRWFISQNSHMSTHEQIAKQYKVVRDAGNYAKTNFPVTQDDYSSMIAHVRMDMELHHKTTLYNVKRLGYKTCDPDELALYTAKFVKRTILYADRTDRLARIVDRRRIPGALTTVFSDSQGRIKNLSVRGKRFVNVFVGYMKDERKKQIEDKRNEKTSKKRSQIASQKR